MKSLALACDHAGFELKEKIKAWLLGKGYKVLDFGTDSNNTVDYPDYIKRGASVLSNGECDGGIFFCGSGVGASIVANRFKNVRCVLANNDYVIQMSRLHNNSNAIAFGARQESEEQIKEWVLLWLNTKFEGERHSVRVDKIEI